MKKIVLMSLSLIIGSTLCAGSPLDRYPSSTLFAAAVRNLAREIDLSVSSAMNNASEQASRTYNKSVLYVKHLPVVKKVQKKSGEIYTSVEKTVQYAEQSDVAKVAAFVAWCALTQIVSNASKQ